MVVEHFHERIPGPAGLAELLSGGDPFHRHGVQAAQDPAQSLFGQRPGLAAAVRGAVELLQLQHDFRHLLEVEDEELRVRRLLRLRQFGRLPFASALPAVEVVQAETAGHEAIDARPVADRRNMAARACPLVLYVSLVQMADCGGLGQNGEPAEVGPAVRPAAPGHRDGDRLAAGLAGAAGAPDVLRAVQNAD